MKLTIYPIPPTINKYIGRSNIWEYQKDKKKYAEDRYKEILMVDRLVEEIKEPPIIENVEEVLEKIKESAREEVKSTNKKKKR